VTDPVFVRHAKQLSGWFPAFWSLSGHASLLGDWHKVHDFGKKKRVSTTTPLE
jgi:hypothetical protein